MDEVIHTHFKPERSARQVILRPPGSGHGWGPPVRATAEGLAAGPALPGRPTPPTAHAGTQMSRLHPPIPLNPHCWVWWRLSHCR
jgi:hypothetical protein